MDEQAKLRQYMREMYGWPPAKGYETMDDDEDVRCPKCGANADDSMFFADDDVEQEQPYCECGYVWPVAVDIYPVDDSENSA